MHPVSTCCYPRLESSSPTFSLLRPQFNFFLILIPTPPGRPQPSFLQVPMVPCSYFQYHTSHWVFSNKPFPSDYKNIEVTMLKLKNNNSKLKQSSLCTWSSKQFTDTSPLYPLNNPRAQHLRCGPTFIARTRHHPSSCFCCLTWCQPQSMLNKRTLKLQERQCLICLFQMLPNLGIQGWSR